MAHVLVGQKRSKQIYSKAGHNGRLKAGTRHACPSAIFAICWLSVGQVPDQRFSLEDMEFEGLAHLVQSLSELKSPANSEGSCRGKDSDAEHFVPASGQLALCLQQPPHSASTRTHGSPRRSLRPTSHKLRGHAERVQHLVDCFQLLCTELQLLQRSKPHCLATQVVSTHRLPAFQFWCLTKFDSSWKSNWELCAFSQSVAPQPAGISKVAAVVWNCSPVCGAAVLAPLLVVPIEKLPLPKGLSRSFSLKPDSPP